MDIQWILAQLFGALGIVVFVAMYHFNKMQGVLRAKLLMDALWATHFFLLGAYTGFVTNCVCMLREIVFMNNKHKFFRSKIWFWLFLIVILFAGFYTWQGWHSVIPAIASSLATISFWQKNVKVARYIGAINNVMMFTYDVFVGSYTGMLGETLAFVSVVAAILRLQNKESNVKL